MELRTIFLILMWIPIPFIWIFSSMFYPNVFFWTMAITAWVIFFGGWCIIQIKAIYRWYKERKERGDIVYQRYA
jgi:hypothetical protein